MSDVCSRRVVYVRETNNIEWSVMAFRKAHVILSWNNNYTITNRNFLN